ncbi:MAG: XRE family transcriptional regulator [Pseudomonadota bacterium]
MATSVKSATRPNLGRILHEQRRRRGWTLEVMSQKTGLAPSTLSKVENNQMGLSFDALVRVADGLGVSFETRFNPGGDNNTMGRRAVTRDGQATEFSTPEYHYDVHGSELLTKRMIPLVMRIKARERQELTRLSRHAGEEYVYVIAGRVQVITDDYVPLSLGAGESIYFDSGMGHGFLSESQDDATILSVCWSAGPYRINEDRRGQPIVMEHDIQR